MKRMHLMKILAAAGCATLLAAPGSPAASYPTEVLADGPLAYYRMSDGVTVAPIDTAANLGSLGAAGNGLYLSSATHPVPGALAGSSDTAASFNGAGQAVRVPYSAALSFPAPFTVEAWVKPAVSPPPSGQSSLAAVLSCGHLADPRSGWLIYQAASGWNLRMYNQNALNTSLNITGGPTPVAGTWYHIAAVFDGTVGKVYVNGVETASGTATGFVPNPDSAFTVGTRSDSAFHYNGAADEVAYYTTALSAAQIAAHYANGINPTPATPYNTLILADSPLLYLRLDEAALVNPPAANAGTLGVTAAGAYYGGTSNAPGPQSPAYPGFEANNQGGSFDGTSGYIGTTNSLLNNRAAYTVMGWLKRGAVHSTRGGYFGQNNLLEFGDAGGGASVEAWIDAIGGNLVQPWPWADDSWGFICLTGDGQNNYLYMDGRVVASATSSVLNYGANTFKFNIGGGGIFNDTGDFFSGWADEVAMFDKPLSKGRILTLYAVATGSATAPEIFTDPVVASPSNNVFATTTFTLSVDVGGALPMSYQWKKGGANIPGATLATYTKVNCSAADNGDYTVGVTNAYGGAETFAPLTVTVDPASPPVITQQPVSRSGYEGGLFTFYVQTTGTTPFSYQWKRGGANLPGETNAKLSVAASGATTGSYSVGITNVAGGVLSASATATLLTPTPGSYEAAVIGASPTSYWRLDQTVGTPGTPILDSLGRNDGVLSGFPTMNQAGAIVGDADTCIVFDGASAKVDVPYSASLNGTTFTVECWAREDYKSGAYASPLTCRDSSANIQHGYIFYDAASGAWENWNGQVGGGWQTVTGPTAVLGAWTHLAMTYDAATTTKKFYVNGVLAASAVTPFAPNLTRPFRIGAGSTEMDGDWWFGGGIDEVAYYPAVLSGDTIAMHYGLARYGTTTRPFFTQQPVSGTNYAGANRTFSVTAEGSPALTYQWQHAGTNLPGATTATLVLNNVQAANAGTYRAVVSNSNGSTNSENAVLTVVPLPTTGYASVIMGDRPAAYYPLDDASSSSTAVEAYNFGAYDGTYDSCLPGEPGATPYTSKSAQFFGSSYVALGNPAGLNFTGPVTLEAWINPQAYPSDFGNIISHGYGGTDTRELILRLNANQTVLFDGYSASTGGHGIATPTAFPLNQWYHLVGAFDGAAYRIYVNGVLVGTSINPVRPAPVEWDWAIGARGGGGERFFTGYIDEVVIYDYALNGYQVANHYYYAQNGTVLSKNIQIGLTGGNVTLTWQMGTLQQADEANGVWTDVPTATSPYSPAPLLAKKFYRLRF